MTEPKSTVVVKTEISNAPRFDMSRPLTGVRFGRRTIIDQRLIDESKPIRKANISVLCRCDCGKESWINLMRIRGNKRLQCRHCVNLKHGETCRGEVNLWKGEKRNHTITYRKWHSMMARVTHFETYKKLGVCDRWKEYLNFKADMGECPDNRLQLDRIDNQKGYFPGNCRWVTSKQNLDNRRTLKIITCGSLSMCIAEWARYLNVPRHIVYKRIKKSISMPDILKEFGYSVPE